jgi:hypothetical protein
MIIENAIFIEGTYNNECSFFSEIKIGSISCVGHSKISSIKPCKYHISHKKENRYYLELIKEEIEIVSSVICNRPGAQLLIF